MKKSVVDREIKHKDYFDCLMNNSLKYADMNLIRSKNHQLYSLSVNKIGLSCYDDKSYLIDSRNSVSYGHYSTI